MSLTKPLASQITYAPGYGISATDLQNAVAELDVEKTSVATLASSTGAALIGYKHNAGDATETTVQEVLSDSVSVFRFMTQAQINDVKSRTKTIDVTLPIQKALSYALTSKCPLRVPAGSYKMSGVTKPSSFQMIDIIGDGADCTEFDYSSFGTTSALTLNGGSGSVTLCRIRGIQFSGSQSSVGITIVGQGGVRPTDCRFGMNARGIVLHNLNSGEFSEFNVAENCEFTSTCATPLEYRRTLGNDSFHGSGLQNCLINSKSTLDPVILVGQGCFVYNAPMTVTVFPSPAGSNIIYNKNTIGSLNNNWYGHIALEPTTSAGVSIAVNDVGARTFVSGAVSSINDNWSLNDCILVDTITIRANGTVNYTPKPYTITKLGCVNGSTVDLKIIDTYSGVDSGLLLNITLSGTNYRYTHICALALDNGYGGGNQISQLAVLQAFNTAGWGASTFSVNGSGQLVINNGTVGFSTTVTVAVSPIGF